MDELLRGINTGKDTRVVGAVTTDLVTEACRRHDLQGLDAVVLGRAMTAACLLATLTKNDDERVRIQLRGQRRIRQILIDAHSDGKIRGMLSTRPGPIPVLDPDPKAYRTRVGHLVGEGQIVVTRDMGLEKEYQGVVALESGEIDVDLERYLTNSEQLPSVLACEVELDSSGTVLRSAGILCQTFPDSPPEVFEPLRDFVRDGGLADLLRADRTVEEVVGFALLGESYEAMERRTLRFHCPCGRRRALAVVSTLGAEDIEQLAAEQDETSVTCNYCNDDYVLSKKDLLELADQMRNEMS
ncbi:MAG: Hsp33 family molecular chaperone HslO [Nannocystaceae bacterium]|nr:Hsp33 family molecular chaperone HslO [Nannocystaceae bacterium]